jgi:hypothetical protein
MPKSEQGFWRDQPASKINVDFKFKHRWMKKHFQKNLVRLLYGSVYTLRVFLN